MQEMLSLITLLFPETEASGAGEHGGSYACCYNGCVSTCTKKMEPPIGETFCQWC
jgi:hypothetical protein